MQSSDIPAKFPIPFAANAGGGFVRSIPQASQIGINNGYASLNDGFPPLNFSPIAAGGIPPFGQDMNGILLQSTSWDRWFSAGGPVFYDSAFATAIGGYPKGATVRSSIVFGNMWTSTIENNTSDPDAFGAGWVSPPNMWATGDTRSNLIPNNTPSGWVPMRNGFTLGAPGSPATYASADAVFLYVKTWLGYSNAQCPVSGGRGANALADFNALKPIQIFDMSGTAIVANDGSTGRLTGVPVVSGNANTTSSIVGENLHALGSAENGAHSHSGITSNENQTHQHAVSGTSNTMNQNNPHNHNFNQASLSASVGSPVPGGNPWGIVQTSTGTSFSDINHTHNIGLVSDAENAVHNHYLSIDSSGAGTPHNTTSRSVVVDMLQKL